MSFNTTNLEEFEWRITLNQRLLYFSNFTITPIGLILILLQILVYFRKKFLETTVGTYYITSSINYFILQIMTGVRFATQTNFYQLESSASIGCKLAGPIFRLFYFTCMWLLFVITLDRFLFILYPTKYQFIRTKKFARILITIIYVCCILLNILWIFSEQAESFDFKNQKIKICTSSKTILIIREVMAVGIGFSLPLLASLIINILLIYKVIEARQYYITYKESNFSITLMIWNSIFFIMNTPLLVYALFVVIININPVLYSNPDFATSYALFDTCAFALSSLGYSSSLLVQIIFNDLFRNEFRLMLFSLKFVFCHSKIESTTVSNK